ncbi:MAG: hypothetical protein NTZ61_03850, partial [Proteobacteria bacterium]|nr:hypothetical protein [Pseudomonadota bacterium]
MKLLSSGSLMARVALVGVALGTPARAMVVASNEVSVELTSGTILVASTVEDDFFGDPTRWLFQYQLSGNYEPSPPDTNGISSLQILFGGLVQDVTGQTGPAGWVSNAIGVAPPFGAGWDLPNSEGFGVGPTSGDVFFSFAVPAETAFTSEDQGSYAASHSLDVPFGLVALVDDASGEGPIVPVPEPTSLLLGLGAG